MRKNEKSTAASGTVACDGEKRLHQLCQRRRRACHRARASDGKQLWQTKIGDYMIHQGYGASPAVYQSLVIAAADSHAGGVVAGRSTAKRSRSMWKHDRPKEPNYTSPIILNVRDATNCS